MSDLNVALAVLGGAILALSLVAGLIKEKVYLPTQPLIAVLVGVAIGPAGFGLLQLANWADPMTILEQAARLTIGFSVMAAALRIPRTYFSDQLKAMGSLLSLGQVMMWLISGLLAYWLLGLPFWVGLLVGAIVTPTDPVIASTIVSGETAKENIPNRIRNLISAESGANDGGAYPLVFLAVLMIEHPFGRALGEWLTTTLLWEVLFAVLVGLAIGAVTGRIQQWSLENDYIDETPLTTITIALTILVLGAVKLLGSDGILAVFAAGLAFNRVAPGDPETEEEEATETVEHLFTIPIFVLFGMALPWNEWIALGWAGVALVGAVLVLRRLPMMFTVGRLVPPLQRTADRALAGWFGPIGVAAIFYATLSTHHVGTDMGWIVGSLIITGSIVAYAITTTSLTKLYGQRTGETATQGSSEGATPVD